MSSALRSLSRGVATHNMKVAGIHSPHENIKDATGTSWFGANWRQWVKRSKENAKKKRMQEVGAKRGGSR